MGEKVNCVLNQIFEKGKMRLEKGKMRFREKEKNKLPFVKCSGT